MSVFQALDAARAAGIEFKLDGKNLDLIAASEPPPDVLDMLRRHKRSILALLQQDLRQKGLQWPTQPWDPDDWRGYFDERAAIAELDGRLSREKAEALAFETCITEWLVRNAVYSAPEACCHCSGPETTDRPLLPIGFGGAGEAWMHQACVAPWRAARRAGAISALTSMGLATRAAEALFSVPATIEN